jgi:hypothetical protein
MSSDAVRHDLGEILSRGEPGCGMGQGEVVEEAPRSPGEGFWDGELTAVRVKSEQERAREAGEASPGELSSEHNGVVHVDFGGRGRIPA